MAVVTKEVLVQAGVERLFEVLVDYPRYPEFVPGIKACRVLRGRGARSTSSTSSTWGSGGSSTCSATRRSGRRRVSWSLVSGDALKVSNGSWELSPEGNATRARYSVDIQVARLPLVPQALIDKMSDQLTRVQLPRTLEAFRPGPRSADPARAGRDRDRVATGEAAGARRGGPTEQVRIHRTGLGQLDPSRVGCYCALLDRRMFP